MGQRYKWRNPAVSGLARRLLLGGGKAAVGGHETEGVDVSYDYERYEPRAGERDRRSGARGSQSWPRTFDRLMDWLRDRPAESWLFFAAGVVLAMLLG